MSTTCCLQRPGSAIVASFSEKIWSQSMWWKNYVRFMCQVLTCDFLSGFSHLFSLFPISKMTSCEPISSFIHDIGADHTQFLTWRRRPRNLPVRGLKRPKVSEIVIPGLFFIHAFRKKAFDANELAVCLWKDELGSIQWSPAAAATANLNNKPTALAPLPPPPSRTGSSIGSGATGPATLDRTTSTTLAAIPPLLSRGSSTGASPPLPRRTSMLEPPPLPVRASVFPVSSTSDAATPPPPPSRSATCRITQILDAAVSWLGC